MDEARPIRAGEVGRQLSFRTDLDLSALTRSLRARKSTERSSRELALVLDVGDPRVVHHYTDAASFPAPGDYLLQLVVEGTVDGRPRRLKSAVLTVCVEPNLPEP